MKNAVFTFCFTLLSLAAFAQAKTIKLNNPSFEDYPQAAHAPEGWYDCGFAGETPPDVNPTGQFRVTQGAKVGSTYLGMVTRDNNTWEAIGQELKYPLLPDTCYELTVYLMTSPIYQSQSRVTGRDANYIKSTKLMVYGSNGDCEQGELLAASPAIETHEWTKYRFVIKSTKKFNHIMLMAYYANELLNGNIVMPTNGNILVDGLSNITPCSCTKSEEKK